MPRTSDGIGTLAQVRGKIISSEITAGEFQKLLELLMRLEMSMIKHNSIKKRAVSSSYLKRE